MVKNYELYLILNSELTADVIKNETKSITDLLEAQFKATDVVVDAQGIQRLAYPIKKHVSGFYTLITFNVPDAVSKGFAELEKKFNINDNIMRYLIVNQTEFLTQKAKEKRTDVEIKHHRELNKGTGPKKCIVKYSGIKAVDYKDVSFLNQFTSPYAKIFGRARTGTSSKYQRKVTQAIKRARHMALMPFTPKYFS